MDTSAHHELGANTTMQNPLESSESVQQPQFKSAHDNTDHGDAQGMNHEDVDHVLRMEGKRVRKKKKVHAYEELTQNALVQKQKKQKNSITNRSKSGSPMKSSGENHVKEEKEVTKPLDTEDRTEIKAEQILSESKEHEMILSKSVNDENNAAEVTQNIVDEEHVEREGSDVEMKVIKKEKKPRKPRKPKPKPVVIPDPDEPFPSVSTGFNVGSEFIEDMLTTWHFFTHLGKLVRVSSFSLDIFEQSLCFAPNSPLLDTLFGSILSTMCSDFELLKELASSNDSKVDTLYATFTKQHQSGLDANPALDLILELILNILQSDSNRIEVSSTQLGNGHALSLRRFRKMNIVSSICGKVEGMQRRIESSHGVESWFGFYVELEVDERVVLLRKLVDEMCGVAMIRKHVDSVLEEAVASEKNLRENAAGQKKAVREQIKALALDLEEYRKMHGLDKKSKELAELEQERKQREEEKLKWQHLKKSKSKKRSSAASSQKEKGKAVIPSATASRHEALKKAKAEREEEEHQKSILKGEETRVQKLNAAKARMDQLNSTEHHDAASHDYLAFIRHVALGRDRHDRLYFWFPEEGRIFIEFKESLNQSLRDVPRFETEWSYIADSAQLDLLLKWLSEGRDYEVQLKSNLNTLYTAICAEMKYRNGVILGRNNASNQQHDPADDNTPPTRRITRHTATNPDSNAVMNQTPKPFQNHPVFKYKNKFRV